MDRHSFYESGRDAPPSLDRLTVDAAALLISDDGAWKMQSPTKSAIGCRSVQKLGVRRRNGELVTSSPPCRTYGHRPCAETLVRKYLQTVDLNLGSDRSGWVAVVDEDEFATGRLRDRLYRYRLKHPNDVRAWYRVVKRSDGTRWVLSTVRLGGRLPPASMEPVDDLLLSAVEALRLPGVVGFHGTHWPIKPPGDPESDLHSFGSFTDDTKDAFLVAVASEVHKQYGERIDPMVPLPYGGVVTTDQYIECGNAVLESM